MSSNEKKINTNPIQKEEERKEKLLLVIYLPHKES